MKDDIRSTPDFDPAAMRVAARRAGALLKALANSDRLLLLCQLTLGEQRVGELENVLDLRQPSLSQQLGVLRQEGLVATRREGKQIYYSIASEEALAVLRLLYRLYCKQEVTA
ncbi:Biofilm growth-associated repressor [Massilia sp. Bi118]|uniref:ArsR/SmtB family transcription factor n=1 Tax=Massilia sp. Bi118 TaxID=2822346 RepID=UPI001D628D82|nr:metalloregulator ArsR/SmtB family transcription factor [Massilia sp. Bi118]CAH0306918.1 Biofilm growth-associated repressor [Massilia sp. Bi118]